MNSTLGYEFLSRGYKCVSFTNNFPIYGQHHNFNRKGLFWSDTSNFKEMTALIDSVKLIKNSDWKKIIKSIVTKFCLMMKKIDLRNLL